MPAKPTSAVPASPVLSWDALEKAYPTDKIAEGCADYENQCSIRMSRALQVTGFPLSGYGDPVCRADGYSHARGAESLANYLQGKLKKTLGLPLVLRSPTDDSAVKGKKGIIFFKDITGFRNGIGDHIDLWDGTKTKGYNGFGVSKQVWFWELK